MIPLAFSSSQAFRVFFKMFVGIVVAGGSHGLVFLPVCLSLVGPGGTAEPEMKIQPESCAKGAATEQISNVIGANESNVAVTTLPDDHEGARLMLQLVVAFSTSPDDVHSLRYALKAPAQAFDRTYLQLDGEDEKNDFTWVHTKGLRSFNVKGIQTGLRYSCLAVQKSFSSLEGSALEAHMKVLCRISHPHLCKVIECFEEDDERLVICEKPSMERLFTGETGEPWSLDETRVAELLTGADSRKSERIVAEMMRQILSALAHGHARGCVHAMITPDKIRVMQPSSKSQSSKIPQLKVIGFGLAYALLPPLGIFLQKDLVKKDRDVAAMTGLPYTAMESMLSKEVYLNNIRSLHDSGPAHEIEDSAAQASPRISVLDESGARTSSSSAPRSADLHLIDGQLMGRYPPGADKADVWAVGALAYRLLTGVTPFLPNLSTKRREKKEDLLNFMQEEPIKFLKSDWANRSSKCLDAVRCMLRMTPSLRPSAADLLRHPWLKLGREPVPYVRVHRLFANGLNYLKETQFKKLVIRVIAEQMPETGPHMQQAQSVFRALDRDRDCLLSPAEFLEGLRLFPDLMERLGEDPEKLFEAADRDGSGFLDSKEFAACTMPPAKSREQEVIWYAFRAFDGDDDKEVTVEKVLQAARLLEGKLQASEQIAELLSVLQAELQRLRVPMRRERIEEAEDEDPDAELRVEGEEEEAEAEMAHMPSQASQELNTSTLKSMSANVSFKDSRRGQHGSKPKKGSWLQRRGQAMIEHARRWVTRPRVLDYGELVYLCDTRRKGVGPGKILYRAARKEFFRVMLKYDLDFYEVVHKVPEETFPVLAGAAAATPWSCYCATGGLYSSKQQKLQEKEKADKKEKARQNDDTSDASSAGGDILPQEAEVKMLRAEEENLQQQLQSLLQETYPEQGPKNEGIPMELQAVQEAMPKEEPSQDVSAEIALLGCFQEVAVKHRALFFPEGQEPLSRDHEVVASYIADNLHASS
eukprot:s2194_g11.t3